MIHEHPQKKTPFFRTTVSAVAFVLLLGIFFLGFAQLRNVHSFMQQQNLNCLVSRMKKLCRDTDLYYSFKSLRAKEDTHPGLLTPDAFPCLPQNQIQLIQLTDNLGKVISSYKTPGGILQRQKIWTEDELSAIVKDEGGLRIQNVKDSEGRRFLQVSHVIRNLRKPDYIDGYIKITVNSLSLMDAVREKAWIGIILFLSSAGGLLLGGYLIYRIFALSGRNTKAVINEYTEENRENEEENTDRNHFEKKEDSLSHRQPEEQIPEKRPQKQDKGYDPKVSPVQNGGTLQMPNWYEDDCEYGEDNPFYPYHMIRKLKSGGMADIFLVEGKSDKAKYIGECVIKVPRNQEGFWGDMTEREQSIWKEFNHDNIVRIYEICENRIVMEYVDGYDLSEIFDAYAMQNKVLGNDPTIYIVRQVCRALDHVHKKNTVHRDVKPQNILISHDGRVKLGDFGLAKKYIGKKGREKEISRAGQVKGTIAYMSPEQAKGEELDHRTDIFSLGIIFYELLSGKRLFVFPEFEPDDQNLQAMKDPIIPDLHETHPEIPGALSDMVMKCLAKDRDSRYSSVQGLMQEMETYSLREGPSFGDTHLAQFMKAFSPFVTPDDQA